MFMRTCFTSLAMLGVAGLTPLLRGDDNSPLIVWQVSEEALNRRSHEAIEHESQVNGVILATHVVGTAKTTGKPRVCLVDCDTGPTVKVMFSGETVSRTTGYHFPVVIYSRSRTDFTVEKLVSLDQLNDVAAHPTKFQATTDVVTENITTSRRRLLGKVVLRKAWQAVAASEPQAKAIAQRDAQRQIVAEFEKALKVRIEKMKKEMSLRDLVTAVLPADTAPVYRVVTKGGYLSVAVFAHDPESKIVDLNLPTLTIKEQSVQLWLHKSLAGDKLSTTENKISAARNWLAFTTFLSSPAAADPASGPQWLAIEDWFVVQLSGMEK